MLKVPQKCSRRRDWEFSSIGFVPFYQSEDVAPLPSHVVCILKSHSDRTTVTGLIAFSDAEPVEEQESYILVYAEPVAAMSQERIGEPP